MGYYLCQRFTHISWFFVLYMCIISIGYRLLYRRFSRATRSRERVTENLENRTKKRKEHFLNKIYFVQWWIFSSAREAVLFIDLSRNKKKKKSLREPNIFLNGPFLRDSRNPEEYLMKYGSIFYKTIVFIDYFYIYFINEKKKKESVRGKIPSKSIERKEIIEAYIFLYVKQFSYCLVCSIKIYHVDYTMKGKRNLYTWRKNEYWHMLIVTMHLFYVYYCCVIVIFFK